MFAHRTAIPIIAGVVVIAGGQVDVVDSASHARRICVGGRVSVGHYSVFDRLEVKERGRVTGAGPT